MHCTNSPGSLASQRHPGKFPKVPGRRRGPLTHRPAEFRAGPRGHQTRAPGTADIKTGSPRAPLLLLASLIVALALAVSSCQLMFLGVRSSLESGFGLKPPASLVLGLQGQPPLMAGLPYNAQHPKQSTFKGTRSSLHCWLKAEREEIMRCKPIGVFSISFHSV